MVLSTASCLAPDIAIYFNCLCRCQSSLKIMGHPRQMVAGSFSFQPIDTAAIRARNATVVGNGQKNSRMPVPSFVLGTAAIERQIAGGNDGGLQLAVVMHSCILDVGNSRLIDDLAEIIPMPRSVRMAGPKPNFTTQRARFAVSFVLTVIYTIATRLRV